LIELVYENNVLILLFIDGITLFNVFKLDCNVLRLLEKLLILISFEITLEFNVV